MSVSTAYSGNAPTRSLPAAAAATPANDLRRSISEEVLATTGLSTIARGRWANADIYRVRTSQLDLAVKDYGQRPFLVRWIWGRWSLAHERRAIRALRGVPGVAPALFRVGAFACAYPYVPGTTIREAVACRGRLPRSFFAALERLVGRMHRRGVYHLDLRNLRNILVDEEQQPHLIDFQSAVTQSRLPRPVAKLLRAVDLSGVYKAWSQCCDEPLPAAKQRFLVRFGQLRRLWLLRGYPLSHALRRRRPRAIRLAAGSHGASCRSGDAGTRSR